MTVTGTVNADTVPITVFILVDGAQTETQECSGDFSIDVDLQDGEHTIRAQAEGDGHVAKSEERRVFVDTELPSDFTVVGPDDFTDHYGTYEASYLWGLWVGDGGSDPSPLEAIGYNSFTNPGWFHGYANDSGAGVSKVDLGGNPDPVKSGYAESDQFCRAPLKFPAEPQVLRGVTPHELPFTQAAPYSVRDGAGNETTGTTSDQVAWCPIILQPGDNGRIAVQKGSEILVAVSTQRYHFEGQRAGTWLPVPDASQGYPEPFRGYSTISKADGMDGLFDGQLNFQMSATTLDGVTNGWLYSFDVLRLKYDEVGQDFVLEFKLYGHVPSNNSFVQMVPCFNTNGVPWDTEVAARVHVDVYDVDITPEGGNAGGRSLHAAARAEGDDQEIFVPVDHADHNKNNLVDYQDPAVADDDPALVQLWVKQDESGCWPAGSTVKILGGAKDLNEHHEMSYWDLSGAAPSLYTGEDIPVGDLPKAIFVRGDAASAARKSAKVVCEGHPGGGTIGWEGKFIKELPATVVWVDIKPAEGQCGQIGDMVDSRFSALGKIGEKHFVTPKDLSEAHLVLEAKITPADVNFETACAWTGDAADLNGQGVVTRYTADKRIAKVVTKSGGEADRMNVWVVWTDITAEKQKKPCQHGPLFGRLGPCLMVEMGYKFVHTIIPQEIVARTADIPYLELPYKGSTPPQGGLTYKDDDLTDGAKMFWDTSRKVRQKLSNPEGLVFPPQDQWCFASYPDYPSAQDADGRPGGAGAVDPELLPVIGNDDPGVANRSDSNDPYRETSHLGKLIDEDTPNRLVQDNMGVDGNTLELKVEFIQFTRLNIGNKWYRISDDKPWRVDFRFKHGPEQWSDDGSDAFEDNAGF